MRKLTTRQRKAISALVQTPTIKAAAELADVAYSTIRLWLDQEHFKVALDAELDAIRDATRRRLVQGAGVMLDVLDEIATHPANNPGDRLRAVVSWFDISQNTDILKKLDRLEELEGKVNERD